MNGKSVRNLNGKSVHEHYNRLPDSVLRDKRLSFAARCVYAVLAGAVHQGTVAKIGQRRIAGLLGCHQETVLEALRDLALAKHVEIAGEGRQRRSYHLTSNVFGAKQRALDAGGAVVEELVSCPRPRLATVRKTA